MSQKAVSFLNGPKLPCIASKRVKKAKIVKFSIRITGRDLGVNLTPQNGLSSHFEACSAPNLSTQLILQGICQISTKNCPKMGDFEDNFSVFQKLKN